MLVVIGHFGKYKPGQVVDAADEADALAKHRRDVVPVATPKPVDPKADNSPKPVEIPKPAPTEPAAPTN
ncbi:hypothetical protein [Methylosinus sp. PW1]|uniref:hypothetical protein n=1 Tax=Methylosinus sp. PW1 TaxID=107636 RepID=UPI00055A4A52|nr:hypothetical protein [Methylosinus sp. PW1]